MAGFDIDPNTITWDAHPADAAAASAIGAPVTSPVPAGTPDASGIIWDAHPSDSAQPSPNAGMSEPEKYAANAITGLRMAVPSFLGLPNTLSRAADYLSGKVGLTDGTPSYVTRNTSSPQEIAPGLYDIYNGIGSKIGLPTATAYTPETFAGKVGQDILAGAPLALAGPGGLTGLAAREVMNAGGALGTDTAAKIAPDSPGLQLMAGLLGSIPGARMTGPFRSTYATGTPSAAQNLQQNFNDLNIPSNVFTTSQGPVSKATVNILSRLPGTSGPVQAGMERTLSATNDAAQNIAGRLGTATNPAEGGTALRTGIGNYRDDFQTQSGNLYDAFDQHMNPSTQVDLTNTLNSLQGPMSRFPTNPQLGQAITNPTLQKYFNLLQPQQTGIPGLVQGGTLTFPELQEFRTAIGRQISDPGLINDIPRADLKNVYGAISDDLQNAATQQSPQALQAFNTANNFYKAGMNRIDQFEPLLNGSPEQSFAKINAAAGKTGSANAGLLQTLQTSLPPSDWQNVGSAVIRRMGEPTPGAADLAAPQFSATTMATNWNRLSDDAKDTLFGQNTPGSVRSDLEKLVGVSNAQKNVSKFANHSNTASHLGIGGLMVMGAEHVPEMLANPHTIIPTVLGGLAAYGGANATARALMTPGFSRWLYQTASIPRPVAWVQALGQLANMSRLNTGLQPIVQQLGGQPSQPGQ